MTKYDNEIREVESRLERERRALRMQAENLTTTARRVAASPKGLLAAAALGFVVGKLNAPRRRRRGSRDTRDPNLQPAAKALGIGGLLGSAALTFVRQRYGSPWVLASRALHYYRMQKQAQMRRQPGDQDYAPPRRPRRASVVRPTEPAAPATQASVRPDSDVVPIHGDSARKTHVAT